MTPQATPTISDHYRKTAEAAEAEARRLRRRMHTLGTFRLLLVVGLVALWIAFADRGWEGPAAGSALLVVLFVAGMVRHNRLAARKAYVEALRTLCENELKGLDHDFSAFDGTAEKIDAGHPFSLDLDLFGERSLFQSLNRTVIPQGRERLVGWLLSPLTERSGIEKRQCAVKELSENTALRHHFRVTGTLRKKDAEITLAEPPGFTQSPFWRAAIWIVPALWGVLIALCVAGVLNFAALSLFFVVSAAVANGKILQINKIHRQTDRASATLDNYACLMEIVEGSDLSAELFQDIRGRLLSGGIPASAAVKQLSARLGELDQRANLFAAILNVFVLRDIRSALRVADWQHKHGRDVDGWFGALGEFDALCSLAGFAYNHPEYVWPEIADGYFTLSGRALGHPLMRRDTCVRNDIAIDRHPYFMIVTGANMAGKSTFLRTVGVNFVLACTGVPVCAEWLRVSPCSLVTSLRTSDSLADGESYFFAELKRLKMMIDRLRAGEKLFIILDEILKGTNSVDKQRGSLGLVRQLVALDACGIIATHDLMLGTLADELPDRVENYRFEADIAGDTLSFSYKLREGVAENMNASFLMQKMGITI